MSDGETYLGDGLYASFDGFMYTLRAPREFGDHWVGLEPEVLREFLKFVQRTEGPLIKEPRRWEGRKRLR